MPYTINHYNGDFAVTVADGTVDTSYAVKLVGKNYAGYGELQNENFLALLENFANGIEPARKTAGQLWYNSTDKKLKFFDGSKFKSTGGAEITDSIEPLGLVEGDFWWKRSTKQLFSKNNVGTFTLIGPQAAGTNQTEMFSRELTDTRIPAQNHPIIEARVNGLTSFIIAPIDMVPFDIDKGIEGQNIAGFTTIHPGITLALTEESDPADAMYGVTDSTDIRFFGTATNSDKLGGILASNFVRNDQASGFTRVVRFADAGYTVGDSWATNGLLVDISGAYPRIQTQGSSLRIQTKASGVIKTPIKLVGNAILNGGDDNDGFTYDIGSLTVKFNTVYANVFDGAATKADSVSVGGIYRTASVDTSGTGTGNTIVARDSTGNINAVLFQGVATSANYADLAEKYLADADYEVGTVVMIGGDKEVTATQVGFRAIGAVSANPAYMMNSELEGGTYIALKGRVPVKVIGHIAKGQRLVAGADGTAQAAFGNTVDYFAIALETSADVGTRLVEALIL
jgi:hypothetical protein